MSNEQAVKDVTEANDRIPRIARVAEHANELAFCEGVTVSSFSDKVIEVHVPPLRHARTRNAGVRHGPE